MNDQTFSAGAIIVHDCQLRKYTCAEPPSQIGTGRRVRHMSTNSQVPMPMLILKGRSWWLTCLRICPAYSEGRRTCLNLEDTAWRHPVALVWLERPEPDRFEAVQNTAAVAVRQAGMELGVEETQRAGYDLHEILIEPHPFARLRPIQRGMRWQEVSPGKLGARLLRWQFLEDLQLTFF